MSTLRLPAPPPRLALTSLRPRSAGRDRDVALAVAQGRTNAEIAASLGVSVATVKAHLTHILDKLELSNRTQVAMLAHDAGLI